MATICNSSENSTEESIQDKRKKCLLGDLPPDFLRLSSLQEEQDAHTAQLYQAQLVHQSAFAHHHSQQQQHYATPHHLIQQLSVTIVEAKLTKNYGLTRMDPYAKLYIGNHKFETHTAMNGSKNPIWRQKFQCQFREDFAEFYLEIYDEKTMSEDECIAWVRFALPNEELKAQLQSSAQSRKKPAQQSQSEGETAAPSPQQPPPQHQKPIEKQFLLSGKQGVDKEGTVTLCFFTKMVRVISNPYLHNAGGIGQQIFYNYPPSGVVQTSSSASAATAANQHPPESVTSSQQQQQNRQQQEVVEQREISGEQIDRIQEMFPIVDREAIKTCLESTNGEAEAAIAKLLAQSD